MMRKKNIIDKMKMGCIHILGLAFFVYPAFSQQNQDGSRPNIVFLLSDDHRWNALGYAGNEIIQTPELDRLAEKGVYFNNAYVTTSICAVSRASILSGQYAARHGIHDFATPMSPEALGRTYAQLLRAAGYYTGFIGKYGIGKEGTLPTDRFDEWYGFPGQGKYAQKDAQGNYIHLTELMGNQAEEFLERAGSEQPFCLSVSFKAPHTQGNRYLHDPADSVLYATDSIPFPVTGDDQYYEAFPDFFKENNEGRKRWQVRYSTPALYQENVRRYYRLITEVDRVVGRIRAKLAEKGLDRNTIIIFTGDNGYYLGEHGLSDKWFGHEESIRVPLIYYDPRLPQNKRGQTKEEMVLNIDIAPTILTLADAPIPVQMQGVSLTALLEKPNTKWRDRFFYQHLFQHPGIPRSEGVVGRRYKYLRYIDNGYEELYDNKKDPHEITNLALDKQHRRLLEKMRAQYRQLKNEAR